MLTRYSIFSLVGVGALVGLVCAGCGGNATPPPPAVGIAAVALEEDELTQTADESSDNSQAALEAADDEQQGAFAAVLPRTSPDLGASASDLPRTNIGAVVRAIGRGVRLCDGHVTVTPKMKAPPCGKAGALIRSGVTIVFNMCALPGGGSLDGSIDVDIVRALAAGESCGPTATIDVTDTVTITALSYVSPRGAKILYPMQTDTGSYSHAYLKAPTSIQFTTDGERQRFDATGKIVVDHKFSGSQTLTLVPGDPTSNTAASFKIDGAFTLQHLLARYTAVFTKTGITRVADCCRPIAGTLEIARTGSKTDSHTWTFGPMCGQVAVDATPVTVAECD